MEKNICYSCFGKVDENEKICPHCKHDLTRGNTSPALPCGTVLGGRYILGKALGQGGFGITYLAQDYKTKELVAVKEFFPEAMAGRSGGASVAPFSGERGENYLYGKECFLNEARTLSEFIGNPAIVRVLTYFQENNTAYFAMEYIDGISLENYLNSKGGKIPYKDAENIILPIMDALIAVHAKGIIHRDISPDNIILTKDGKVKLIDFGAARYSLGDRSRSLDVVLKHGYAPREQYSRHGKQGPFTDVYAVAATLYRAVTGRIPPDSIDRIDDDSLISPSTLGVSIPVYAEEAIYKALAVRPEERFRDMAQFKAALLSKTQPAPAQYTREAQPAPAPVPAANQGAPAKKNKPWLIAVASAAAALAVFVMGFIAVSLINSNKTAGNEPTAQVTSSTTDTNSNSSSVSSAILKSGSSSSSSDIVVDTTDDDIDDDDSIGERVSFTFFSIEVPDGMVYEENDETGAVTFYDDYNYDLYEDYHMGMVFSIQPLSTRSEINEMPRAKLLGKSKGCFIAAILPTDVQWDANDKQSEKSYKVFYDNYEEILDTIELKN